VLLFNLCAAGVCFPLVSLAVLLISLPGYTLCCWFAFCIRSGRCVCATMGWVSTPVVCGVVFSSFSLVWALALWERFVLVCCPRLPCRFFRRSYCRGRALSPSLSLWYYMSWWVSLCSRRLDASVASSCFSIVSWSSACGSGVLLSCSLSCVSVSSSFNVGFPSVWFVNAPSPLRLCAVALAFRPFDCCLDLPYSLLYSASWSSLVALIYC